MFILSTIAARAGLGGTIGDAVATIVGTSVATGTAVGTVADAGEGLAVGATEVEEYSKGAHG